MEGIYVVVDVDVDVDYIWYCDCNTAHGTMQRSLCCVDQAYCAVLYCTAIVCVCLLPISTSLTLMVPRVLARRVKEDSIFLSYVL